jgi:hypothetical protein
MLTGTFGKTDNPIDSWRACGGMGRTPEIKGNISGNNCIVCFQNRGKVCRGVDLP